MVNRTLGIAAAKRLTTGKGRREAGAFLAEGRNAVSEALHWAASGGGVSELFVTAESSQAFADIVRVAQAQQIRISEVSPKAIAALSETVTPQGLVAVCQKLNVSLEQAFAIQPRLVVALSNIRDPGNAGTILRTADAAGAQAVIFADDSVDPYNGKCVRASAGSLFHLSVVDPVPLADVVAAAHHAGCQVLATAAGGEQDLHELSRAGALAQPTMWIFGNEAHGLAPHDLDLADQRVSIPLYGKAESLNLAAAAAVVLYESARAQRGC